MTTTEKIRKLCEANSITINKLEKELGIGRGNIGRWYKHRPNTDDLLKVANRFNVSAKHLLNDNEVDFNLQFFAEEKPAPGGNELSKKEQLLNLIDSMDRAELIEALKAVTAKLEEV